MARKWVGLRKLAEECGELIVELMKLAQFPSGKHPSRKRSLVLSTEDEIGDKLGIANYFMDKNRLDRQRIERRAAAKYREAVKKWGKVPKAKSPGRETSKPRRK